MIDKEENSGARSAVILAILVVVIAVYTAAFGLPTLVWIEVHHWTSANPWLTEVPKALPAAAASDHLPPLPPVPGSPKKQPAAPELLKAYTYEFAPPWTSKSNIVPSENRVDFRFDSGQVIVFFDPEAQLDTLRALKSTDTIQYSKLRDVFSEPLFASNYDLYQSVYGASPAQTSPFTNAADATRKNALLLWKLSFGFDTAPGIHSFAFGNNRAFEFGDPANGRPVALRVFNGDDKQFRFIFINAPGSASAFTQDDINTAVQTLHSVPLLER